MSKKQLRKNKEMKGDGDVPEEGWSRGKKKVKFGDFFGKKTHLVPRVYLPFDKIIIIIIKH